MSDTESEKPLSIALKDSNGELTHFKVKKKTKMGKIFDAYAAKKGVEVGNMRFLLDGDRVNHDYSK
jgi:small ubiquitin-related modifier